MRPPDFDELVGDDVDGDERARIRRAHDLLVTVGPPPELPASLRRPPRRGRTGVGVPQRVARLALPLAAALALAAFGAGYVAGDRGEGVSFEPDFDFVMRGTEAAPNAFASVVVGEKEANGNWPMEMTVRGLPSLPREGRYELLLTQKGGIGPSCGTFLAGAESVVYLNAPYELRRYDGWVITREGSEEILLRTDRI